MIACSYNREPASCAEAFVLLQLTDGILRTSGESCDIRIADASADVPLRVSAGQVKLELSRGRWRSGEIELPLVFHAPPVRAVGVRDRLLLSTDAGDRSARMSSRTLAELKRRRFSFCCAFLGRSSEVLQADPAEVFEAREPSIVPNLFATARAFLEPCGADEEPSLEAYIATACGLPVVTHRDTSALDGPTVIKVEEWSADAFADAIVAVNPPDVLAQPLAALDRLRSIIGAQ